jgi:hypothetical protein
VRALSGSQDGFGGDLTYGETGAGAGLRGADKICAAAAERAQPGSGSKPWRAFLSTKAGGANDGPVHAKDRVGTGPWYDAMGRLVASNQTQLLMPRPGDAAAAIKDNLPNEFGIPNGMDGCTGSTTCADNHQVITGTNEMGMLYTGNGTSPMFAMKDATCGDWTNKTDSVMYWPGAGTPGRVRVGAPRSTTGCRRTMTLVVFPAPAPPRRAVSSPTPIASAPPAATAAFTAWSRTSLSRREGGFAPPSRAPPGTPESFPRLPGVA